MSEQALSYFSHMSASIPEHDWHEWEMEIRQAESQRLADPTAMDILAARQVSHNDVPQHGEDHLTYTDAEKWIQMAINIEEKQ